MVNQKLIDWIKIQESQGHTLQQIHDYLIQKGYNPNHINEALNIVTQVSASPKTNLSKVNLSHKKTSSWLILIMVIVILAIIGGGIYWFISQNNMSIVGLDWFTSQNKVGTEQNKTGPEIIQVKASSTDNLTDSEGNAVGEMQTNISADVEVTSSCGGMDCFKQKFTECRPATVTSKLTDTIIYYYEIIGPKDGLCEVKSKFTVNPNPEWVNKEMTCDYDNSIDFDKAIQDTTTCQGPLYTLMTEG